MTDRSLTDDELFTLARQAVRLPDAPAALIRRAVAHWDVVHPTPQPSALDAVRRLVASLVFDSWAGGPGAALAVRALPAPVHQLLYAAGAFDVDLRIEPAAGGHVVRGQVLGPEVAGTVTLVAQAAAIHAGPAATAALDALGEFRIDGVATGRYTLVLEFSDLEVNIGDVAVGTLPP